MTLDKEQREVCRGSDAAGVRRLPSRSGKFCRRNAGELLAGDAHGHNLAQNSWLKMAICATGLEMANKTSSAGFARGAKKNVCRCWSTLRRSSLP